MRSTTTTVTTIGAGTTSTENPILRKKKMRCMETTNGKVDLQGQDSDSDGRFGADVLKESDDRKVGGMLDSKGQDQKQSSVDVGDEVNIKRSIEMKNGIALRSMNNFHKGTNAISLNNYRVSV